MEVAEEPIKIWVGVTFRSHMQRPVSLGPPRLEPEGVEVTPGEEGRDLGGMRFNASTVWRDDRHVMTAVFDTKPPIVARLVRDQRLQRLILVSHGL